MIKFEPYILNIKVNFYVNSNKVRIIDIIGTDKTDLNFDIIDNMLCRGDNKYFIDNRFNTSCIISYSHCYTFKKDEMYDLDYFNDNLMQIKSFVNNYNKELESMFEWVNKGIETLIIS